MKDAIAVASAQNLVVLDLSLTEGCVAPPYFFSSFFFSVPQIPGSQPIPEQASTWHAKKPENTTYNKEKKQ